MKNLKQLLLILIPVLIASTMFAADGKSYNPSAGKYLNAEANILLGDDFFEIGEYAEALKYYDQALYVIDTSRIYKKCKIRSNPAPHSD
jgi:tetratricopeptide (TPR) repeat protein